MQRPLSAPPHPRERVCAPLAAVDAPDDVQLTLRVDTCDAAGVRRLLHRALGDAIGVYAMKADPLRGLTTLQLRTSRARLAALMDTIMTSLPRAEFGAVQPMAFAAVH